MPIRITCPSCSATLSVKDEYAGRAVKCPKCGGVIPASQPAPAEPAPAAPAASSPPPPPAPPPAPEKAPHEDSDEPAKPAQTGGRVVGKPVSRSKGADDEEERPRKRRDEDDDRDTRSKKDSGGEKDGDDGKGEKRSRDDRDRDDDERGDRPKRRRRDDDDRPARREKPPSGANAPLLVAIIGFFMLTCCGGVGYGIYWFYNKAKETVETVNFRVTRAGFDRLAVGTTTRAQAEQVLGGAKVATTQDLEKIFPGDAAAFEKWTPMVANGRAVFWRNGDDFLIAAFHPNVEGEARLQMKEWKPSVGLSVYAGEQSDITFLQKYPPGKKPVDPPINPPVGGGKDDEPPPGTEFVKVNSLDLAQEYKTNPAGADAQYKGKWLQVEGKIEYIDPGDARKTDDVTGVRLEGVPIRNGTFEVRCFARQDQASKVLNLTRGQTATFKGKCTGIPTAGFVWIDHCRVESNGNDPALVVTARNLILEFAKDKDAARKKYTDKEVLVTDVEFVSVSDSLANFKVSGKGPAITIQANFTFRQDEKLAKLKPGDRVKFKARAGQLFGATPKEYVSFYEAILVP